MSALVGLVSVTGLALIAAAGVLAGYRRRDPVAIEAASDPLEDRRLALLRSLADLEASHDSGALADPEYRRLRGETEGRISRLLRAMDERHARASTATTTVVEPERGPARVPPWAVATLLVATVGAVLLAGLARDAEPAPGASAPTSTEDPFAFFEQRVRDHPNDLAARLDLARRYLDAGRVEDALAEYAAALELDPDDAEAHASIGLILFLSDRPEEALASVDRALETAPDYPEALFYRGVILLRGLERPADAIEAFERYLEVAPFGAERDAVQQLLAEAEAALASSGA
jgi:tetratricopeptide (TPR) repeat protein